MKGLFYIIIFTVFASLNTVIGQSGYLGHYNGLSINIGLNPLVHQTNVIKDDIIDVKNRLLQRHYSLSYERIVGLRSSLSLEVSQTNYPINLKTFRLSPLALLHSNGGSNDYIFNLGYTYFFQLADVNFIRRSIGINYTFFRKGSHAPLGKFIQLNINASQWKLEDEYLLYGVRGQREDGFLNSYTHDVFTKDTLYLPETKLYNDYIFSISVGRKIPLGDRFVFSFSIRHSLLQIMRIGERWAAFNPIVEMFSIGTRYLRFGPFYHNNLFSNPQFESKSDLMKRVFYESRGINLGSNWMTFNFGLSFYL